VPGGQCNLRSDAQLAIVIFTDTGDQTTDPPPGQPNNSEQSWVNYFRNIEAVDGGTRRAMLNGILCPGRQNVGSNGPCTDNLTDLTLYDRLRRVISQMGGVEGSSRDTDRPLLPTTIRSIMNAVIGAVSRYRLTKPPISASLKVVLQRDGGAVEIPRDPDTGYDYNGAANTVSLFGPSLPDAVGREMAVSYRYWVDRLPPPTSQCPPCTPPLVCNPATGRCECPLDCGAPRPSPRYRCDPISCTWICGFDCNGACTQYQTCNTTSCACECQQNVTCPTGFRFNTDRCECTCFTEDLGCDQQRFDLDPVACTCTCKPDCGGCSESSPCNRALCRCIPQ
jgi:hypothetical protein